MGYTRDVLDEVRADIEVPQPVIEEVRHRRDVVRAAAEQFLGAKHTFPSGSATHWTAIGRILTFSVARGREIARALPMIRTSC